MTQTPTLVPPVSYAQPVYVITNDDKKRVGKIQKAWQAYDGDLEPPLQKTPDGIDPNVQSNRIASPVDAGSSFLFGKELEITVEEGAPPGAQDFLNSVWGEKEARLPLLQDISMNGAMAGRAFLRIMPIADPDDPDAPRTYRLISVDPSTIYVQTAPQDCEQVLLYCIEYTSTEMRDGQAATVAYREEIAALDKEGQSVSGDTIYQIRAWSIQHWSRVAAVGSIPKNEDWTAAGAPISWNYSFPPIFSCKNLPRPNDFWGKPDTTKDLIELNKAINLKQSLMQLSDILTGEAILYATGVGEGIIKRQPGVIIRLPDVDSKIVAVPIPDHSAGQLNALDNLRSDMDEQTHFPGIATGRLKDLPHGNMSGIAIELMFMSSLMRTNTKQCLYGKLILDVSRALLILNGMSGGLKIALAWQSPLPNDDLQDVQAVLAKMEAGMSKTTALRKLGEDPEEELRLAQSEDEQQLVAYARGQGLPQGIPGTPNLPGQLYPPPAAGAGPSPTPGTTGGNQ